MKKFLIAAVIILCTTALSQAEIIIDDFTQDREFTIGPGTNPTGDLTNSRVGTNAHIIGGRCDITFNRSSGPRSLVNYYLVSGSLPAEGLYSSDVGTGYQVGYWRMEYGKNANLNADLSYGASSIDVQIIDSDMCTNSNFVPTTLTVTSGKGTAQEATASKTINIKCDMTYNYKFADFPGVNFADVDYIKIQFDFNSLNQKGADFGITKISTVGTTLIELTDFQSISGNGQVKLTWETASEIDNAGFNIYRSTSENGEYIKINNTIIAAKGSSTQGASYDFIDDAVQNRKTYYYKLEDIDLNGTSTMRGPKSATPRWFLWLFGK
jgi:hypothetical protein